MSETDRRDYRSIGEILGDAREERGWSVEEVSERTKIAPRQIHALEADDLASLSGPVYARGFVRNLCNLYDLDREWVMLKLDAALESGDATQESTAVDLPAEGTAARTADLPPSETPGEVEREEDDTPTWTIETVDNARVHRVRTAPRPVPWLKIVVGGALIAGLAFLVWFAMARSSSSDAGGPTTALESGATSVDPIPAEVGPDRSGEGGAEVTGNPKDTQGAASAGSGNVASEPTPTQEESGEELAGRSSTSAGTEVGEEERVLYDDRGDEGLSSVLRQTTEDLEAFELKLSAIGPVTARVSADGRQPKTRRMRAGQSWILEARDHFTLQLSDVDNVIAEIDGVRRLPPRGDFPEWILYRTIASAEGH